MRILRVVLRVVSRSAVPHADIQKPVRPKGQVAAVVIAERMLDEPPAVRPDQIESAGRVGAQRIGAGSFQARDHDMAVAIGEADEEPAARRIVGGEGQSQQAALAAGGDRASQIDEIRGLQDAAFDHTNTARLLEHQLDRRVGRILNEAKRQP